VTVVAAPTAALAASPVTSPTGGIDSGADGSGGSSGGGGRGRGSSSKKKKKTLSSRYHVENKEIRD